MFLPTLLALAAAHAAAPPDGSIAAALEAQIGMGGPILLFRDGAQLVAASPDGTRAIGLSKAPADWSAIDPWAHVVWSHATLPNGSEALFVTDLWASVSSAALVEGMSAGLGARVKGDAAGWWAVSRYVDLGNFWVTYGSGKSVSQAPGPACNTALDLEAAVPTASAVWGLAGCEAGGETEAQQTARVRTMSLDTTLLGLLRARARATPVPTLPKAPAARCEPINDMARCTDAYWEGYPGTVQPLGTTGFESVMVDYIEGDMSTQTIFKLRRASDQQWVSAASPSVPSTMEAARAVGTTCVSSDGTAAAILGEDGAVSILTDKGGVTLKPSARFVGWLDGTCL